jgi:hypothetical protein
MAIELSKNARLLLKEYAMELVCIAGVRSAELLAPAHVVRLRMLLEEEGVSLAKPEVAGLLRAALVEELGGDMGSTAGASPPDGPLTWFPADLQRLASGDVSRFSGLHLRPEFVHRFFGHEHCTSYFRLDGTRGLFLAAKRTKIVVERVDGSDSTSLFTESQGKIRWERHEGPCPKQLREYFPTPAAADWYWECMGDASMRFAARRPRHPGARP